jgi:RecA-family ATPase
MALAAGEDFIGMSVVQPRKILFWSLEMGHMDLKYFMETMTQGMTQEQLLNLEQNLIIAPVGEAFYLDSFKGQQQFTEIVQSLSVDGVFIDSVGSCTSGSISDEGTVKTLMDFNDHLRKSLGIFTWYIHHNRKAQGDNKKPNKLSDVYGNQYLVNRATSVYCLWPVNKSIEVIPLKKRLAAVEDSWIISRTANLDFKKGSNIQLVKTPSDDALDLNEWSEGGPGMGGF